MILETVTLTLSCWTRGRVLRELRAYCECQGIRLEVTEHWGLLFSAYTFTIRCRSESQLRDVGWMLARLGVRTQ